MGDDRPTVEYYRLPGQIPPGALAGTLAVVVDVLRATTVMVHALDAGCEAIIPCAEIDEARDVAARLPAGTALLGGERAGLPIPGFDLGNSPSSYTPERCRGKTLVMTTTNGTLAILACREAERVWIGAFVNATALARAIPAVGLPVRIVCAGTDGEPSLEDEEFATYLARRIAPSGPDEHLGRYDDAAWLADRLSQGRGGRRVREIGRAADIDDAARLGRFKLIPEWDRTTGLIRPVSRA